MTPDLLYIYIYTACLLIDSSAASRAAWLSESRHPNFAVLGYSWQVSAAFSAYSILLCCLFQFFILFSSSLQK